MSVVVLTMISTSLFAQTPDTVTIRELNTYDNLTEFTAEALAAHPLNGVDVVYTVVITGYPKSSGLSTPVDNNGDGIIDDISRVHFFVTDTTALSDGRAGMSIQIVESDYELVESYTRGDIVTFHGSLSFFGTTAQMTVNDTPAPVLLGNVNNDPSLAKFAPLLDPWEVSIADLNTINPDGTIEINVANYTTYNGAYVKLTNAVVSNVSPGDRPDWAVSNNGSRIYTYDTSLRYRNDRVSYLPSFNYRRAEDGAFVPPAPGATVNLSGYLNVNGGNDPDGVYGANTPFSISPFEDGVLWLNGTRFEDGDDIGAGLILSWPNDIELLGSPPLFSEVMLSDSSATKDDAVTVSANIVGVAGATVTGAKLFYTGNGVTDSLTMTANGDVYSATIPAFPAATAVTFYMTAADDNGLSVRNPIAGEYSYLVEGAITSIAAIQTTTSGMAGDSPLAGVTGVVTDITATVTTSAVTDGYITIQDRSAAWSGVFVDESNGMEALAEGDMIKITELSVSEVFGVTEIEVTAFENLGASNTMMDTLALTGILTQDISANYEPYEGVLITLEDVKVTTNQADGGSDFGEWEIGSRQGGGAADTLEAGEGVRFDDRSSRFGSNVNDHIKIGAQFESLTATLYFSFGNAKLVGGNPDYFVGDDISLPFSGFDLESPADEASVVVTSSITPTWEATTDFDGNEVSYEWVLYSADTSEIIAKVPSNNDGADAEVTLSFATVDGLLAGAGLTVGQSADFVWNVLVNDGVDTVAVSTGYDLPTNTFTPLYYSLTLERGLETSNELVNGVPEKFGLDQNYPNPFNPSTNINFSLPQTSKVTLAVYDMLGRRVATLLDGKQLNAANHSIKFDASALASGMYIYRIEAGSFISTRKMMLIK
ncbi:MAG: hypothetical protein BalsKO_24830 [Balneolaceae bacterium]